VSATIVAVLCAFGLVSAQASRNQQAADAFSRKLAIVNQQAATPIRSGDAAATAARRTPFTEAEVNSWMAYRGQEVLPTGVSEPQVTLVGNGKMKAAAIVDLEQVAKRKATGGTLDPWSYLGGRLPVTLTGTLHTQNGVGRFDLEEAAISGVPVPKSLLQDVIAYYSRSTDDPEGLRLDESFRLPAHIRQIELGQGQAIVVQ
jgi:hypothetical protein